MSLETEFRLAAQELVAEFSVGTHTLRRPNSSYNTTTGAVTSINSDTTAPAVQSEISVRAVEDASYARDHFKVIVAGLDITPFEPVVTDQVVTPAATTHEIMRVKTDQYKAAYILYVKRN